MTIRVTGYSIREEMHFNGSAPFKGSESLKNTGTAPILHTAGVFPRSFSAPFTELGASEARFAGMRKGPPDGEQPGEPRTRSATLPRCVSVAVALAVLLVGSTFFLAPAALAGEPQDKAAITPQAARSIDRGLKYLAQRQQEDGAWGSEAWPRHTGLTAFALMAFMSHGDVAGCGEYGTEVQKGVDFLVKAQKPSGFIVTQWASYGPMYEHALALLALAEAYGMTPREDLKAKIKAGVNLVVKSQAANGEWGYVPTPTVSGDLSVTVCQLMALRAARNCGIAVPKQTIDRAIAYVKKSAVQGGGFCYRLGYRQPAYGCTGAGLTSLYGAGIRDDPMIKDGIRWLLDNAPNVSPRHRWARGQHTMYGHYYATQAMYNRGGEDWEKWYTTIRDHFVKTQERDGGWYETIHRGGIGRVYATGIAVTILLAPYHYLPIFQH